MAHYETTVEVTVKVLFTGTTEEFEDVTKVALNEEAIKTVKALLPSILTTDPTFNMDSGPSFDEAVLQRRGRPWAKAPTAVLAAFLPEPDEAI